MRRMLEVLENMQEVCHTGTMSKFGDMYKAYIRDGEAAEVVEFDSGFLVLKRDAGYLYIETIYVAPEARQQGAGRRFLEHAESMARQEGLRGIIGSCDPERAGATVSMKSMLGTGFELLRCDRDIIYLVKYLEPKGV